MTRADTYGGMAYDAVRLEDLSTIAQLACERGIDIDVFITPIHAWQLEVIEIMGLQDDFENWKRGVVGALETHPCAELWDFTGYSDITTEPVPGDGQSAMVGYFETSHFTADVGDAVLQRMAGEGDAQFGVQLTPQLVEQHLAQLERRRVAYRAAHEDDMAVLRRMVEETMAEREANRQLNR